MNYMNFDAFGRDDQSRAFLIQKYKAIDEAYKIEMEELTRKQNQNADLTVQYVKLQESIFQEKSKPKCEVIAPQFKLIDAIFMDRNEISCTEKKKMEYFAKLKNQTSEVMDCLTNDYKLNPENSLEELKLEIGILQNRLLELNGIKEENQKIHTDLQNEQFNICNQYDREVADYNWVAGEINYALVDHKQYLQSLTTELESKENELAGLKNSLNELGSAEKSMELQCELWKESSKE